MEDYHQLRQDNRNFWNNIVPERIRQLEEEITHLRQNYNFLLEQLQERSREYNFSYNLRFKKYINPFFVEECRMLRLPIRYALSYALAS